MSSQRVVILAVTIVGPDLPPTPRFDRPIHVCFCGRPLPGIERECGECGWVTPALRHLRERAIVESADGLMDEIALSLEALL